ncbi:MAG: hypothetical protein HY013_20130 [Candidatus Solibacter usitatus]|nr:hypothetical protein [Candidatus Solibacter usitatus]
MRTLLGLLLIGAALAADSQISGTYSGAWTGSTAGGSFEMIFTKGEGSKPACEVTFGLGDNQVKTTVKRLVVEGAKVEVTYEFDLGGNKLESTVNGELSGDTLAGKYKTKTVPEGNPVDEGEWKAKKK